jgi:hypothetical protein
VRLQRFWIHNFFGLSDLDIAFDNSASLYGPVSLRFLVGLNGSGKSNALVALGLVFAHLSIGRNPGIEFEVDYELNGRNFRITTRDPNPNTVLGVALFQRAGERRKWQRMEWDPTAEFLPERVVGYATGPVSAMEWGLNRSVSAAVQRELGVLEASGVDARSTTVGADVDQRLNDARESIRRLMDNPRTIFLGVHDAMCATLAVLCNVGGGRRRHPVFAACRERLLKRVGLTPERPIAAFTLRVAGDWEEKLHPIMQDRFKQLLSLRTVEAQIEPQAGEGPIDPDRPMDRYVVFDWGEALQAQLDGLYERPLLFFDELLAFRRRGAVQEIRVVLAKSGVAPVLPERALSDGEYLILGRLSILLLVSELKNCLILLDEPETHFNDRWKIDLVGDIVEMFKRHRSRRGRCVSDMLIATHSDITLTDADPLQVYLFTVAEEDGRRKVRVHRTPVSTFAASRGEISLGLFGASTPIGSFASELVERVLAEETNPKELRRWLDRVGPGFQEFRIRDKLLQKSVGMTGGRNAHSS